MWHREGTLLDPTVVGGGAPLLQRFLISKRHTFVNCYALKVVFITISCQNPYTIHMGCIVYGWRWTCDKKETIHRQWAMGGCGEAPSLPQGGWNLLELGGLFQWARGFIPPPNLPSNSSTGINVILCFFSSPTIHFTVHCQRSFSVCWCQWREKFFARLTRY